MRDSIDSLVATTEEPRAIRSTTTLRLLTRMQAKMSLDLLVALTKCVVKLTSKILTTREDTSRMRHGTRKAKRRPSLGARSDTTSTMSTIGRIMSVLMEKNMVTSMTMRLRMRIGTATTRSHTKTHTTARRIDLTRLARAPICTTKTLTRVPTTTTRINMTPMKGRTLDIVRKSTMAEEGIVKAPPSIRMSSTTNRREERTSTMTKVLIGMTATLLELVRCSTCRVKMPIQGAVKMQLGNNHSKRTHACSTERRTWGTREMVQVDLSMMRGTTMHELEEPPSQVTKTMTSKAETEINSMQIRLTRAWEVHSRTSTTTTILDIPMAGNSSSRASKTLLANESVSVTMKDLTKAVAVRATTSMDMKGRGRTPTTK
jgi:hypothetical protein